jgi:DNA repair exonuclease SbcCD nuclease subunit
MKFLVCGDLHLDTKAPGKRQDDYPEVMLDKIRQVDEIARENTDGDVIQTGDVFNRLNVRNSYMTKIIRTFNECYCSWHSIAGNHDLHFGKVSKIDQSPISILFSSCLQDLTKGKKLQWVQGSNDGTELYDKEAFKEIYFNAYHFDSRFELPKKENGRDAFEVLVVHQYPEDYYGLEKEVIDREKAQQYDLVILGHEHTTKELEFGDTPVLVPGALSRLTAGADDLNRTPVVYTVDIDGGNISWEQHEIDAPDLEEAYDMHEVDKFERKKDLDDYVEQLNTTETNESSDVRGILNDVESDQSVQSVVLQYFNDVGLV